MDLIPTTFEKKFKIFLMVNLISTGIKNYFLKYMIKNHFFPGHNTSKLAFKNILNIFLKKLVPDPTIRILYKKTLMLVPSTDSGGIPVLLVHLFHITIFY